MKMLKKSFSLSGTIIANGGTVMYEKILIVDDEKEITDLVALYLQNENFTVYKFYNALDAIHCIKPQN